tara:strand:+ start:2824 stop:4728 length:1905 start_codon:yes stop_codon:yes gene_type:complete
VAVNTRIVEYFGLRGTKESQDLVSVAAIHSPSGSKNGFLDDLERVTKIPGYTKLTASSIASYAVRGLFSWHYESGGTLTRVLIAVLNDTAYSINTSDGSATSLGTGLGTDDVPRFSKMTDKLFVASGGSAAIKTWDGSTWANAGGTQPTAPSLAAGSAGDLNGQFRIRVAYIKSDNSEDIASAPSSPVLLENEQLAVSSIPTGPGGTLARKLYLTAGDNPGIYYFAHMLDGNAATSVTLDIAESDYITKEELIRHGDAPPTGLRVLSQARGRMFYANKDGDKSAIYPSDLGLPESVNLLEKLEVAKQDGDEILHMEPEFQAIGQDQRIITQVVFKRWGIWNLYGTQPRFDQPDPWILQKTKSPVGAVAGNTVAKVEFNGDNALVFLAPDKTVRLYDGNASMDISADVWNTLSSMNLEYAHLSWAVDNPTLRMVFFFFPVDSSTVPNQCVGWDYRRNVWWVYPDFTTLQCGTLHHATNLDEFIFSGQATAGTGGLIYQMFTGNNFDGGTYDWQWRTKPLMPSQGISRNVKDSGHTWHFDWLEPIFESLAASSITIKVWPGYKDPDEENPFMDTTMSLEDSSATHKKEVVFVENATGGYLVDEEARFQFSESSGSYRPKLLGFHLGVKPKGRKRVS